MNLLLSKPDSLGDQFIAAGVVQALQRLRPDVRIVWHVRSGMEVFAPLIGAEIFVLNLQERPGEEAARLNTSNAPLTVLPYPLNPFETWSDDLRQRLAWWAAFLRATTWDTSVLAQANRTWVGDFTVATAPATQRFGFASNVARQPLVNEAQALAGADAPTFTASIEPSFDRNEAEQLTELFALLEPGLLRSGRPPRLPESESSESSPSDRERPAGRDACRYLWQPRNPWLPSTPDRPRRVLIAAGVGGDGRRAWGIANFRRVAEVLRQHGANVSWIEGPGDGQLLAGLTDDDAHSRLRFGGGELPQLVDALRQADLLICHDTAYVHIAAGLGTPTVAIYGAGQQTRFHPAGGRIKIVQSEIACAGCQWHCLWDRLVCVTDIPVERVVRAAEQMLQQDSTPVRVALASPVALSAAGETLGVRRRLQAEVLALNADRFARLQIIQSLVAAQQTAAAAPTPQAVPPRISIIIPMGRPERADGTLGSLVRQTVLPANLEVLAVGVGLQGVKGRHPSLPLKIVELPTSPGPAHKRVAGVAQASGDWYLFVDDDIQLAPDFVEMLLRILATGSAPGDEFNRVGAIGARLPGGRGTFFERLTDISNFWSQQSGTRAVPHTAWFLYSAAMIVRAEAYRKSGGFNAELMNGEDVDLTQRIQAAGYILAYEPSLVAYHFHGQDTLFRMWRYFWRNGNAAPYFFAQFGGVCCYSIKTVLKRTWGDLQMNRSFQRRKGVRLGWRTPWIFLNYFIVETSLERHYQTHLWENRRYRTLPARTRSDQLAARAFAARDEGRSLSALFSYLGAMLLNFTDPVRR